MNPNRITIHSAEADEVAAATRAALFAHRPDLQRVRLPGSKFLRVKPSLSAFDDVEVAQVGKLTKRDERQVVKLAVEQLRDGRPECDPKSDACVKLRQLVRVALRTLVEVL